MAGMVSDEHPARGDYFRSLLIGIPWLLAIIAGAIACIYVAGRSFPRPTPARLNSCLEKKLDEKLKAKQVFDLQDVQVCEAQNEASVDDLVKEPIEELKWMLEIIGILAGFFVVVQAAAAYFSADAYSKQADRAIDDIERQAKVFRARYPMFERLEKLRMEAQADLARRLKDLSRSPDTPPTEALRWDMKWKLYGDMDVEERQRILSLESFASIDLHSGAAGDLNWSESLRRYALFYESKFEYEKSIGSPSFGDLERAEGYLRLAIEKARDRGKDDPTLCNDLGVLCLDIYDLNRAGSGSDQFRRRDFYLREAKTQFDRSFSIQKRQQRARYNLAVILASYVEPRKYAEAAELLLAALRERNWQQYPAVNPVLALIRYNLGCCQAQVLAGAATTGSPLTLQSAGVQGCLENLEKAVTLGTNGIEAVGPGTIARDCGWTQQQSGEKGDLVALYEKADADLRTKLEDLKEKLLESATKS
ncbi:MAG TPA: hypothetical protein VHX60_09970 [Acidobacteriaceae bacterium]|jgi:hypothetical protein|nr:hypothetical protein [Acidobacteriaceae bacterium]